MTSVTTSKDQVEVPDPVLTSKIVTYLKSQGVFDQFRKECMADVDTKPAYQNLRHRVEGSVKTFLHKNPWKPEMNKSQLRDKLRKHIHSGGFLDMGVNRIVDQVVNPKIYSSFLPKVEEVVQLCLKMDDNKKPTFVVPPRVEEPPKPLRFQDRHNLAPRARLPAPLTGPRLPIIPNIEALKPPTPVDDKDYSTDERQSDPGTPDLDESSDRNYSMDDNDDEDEEEEEESPPFEPNSQSDRLILGIRTDSSDDSNDTQVVTTVVDDNLEDRIDKEDKMGKEKGASNEQDEEEEEEESSSDEYVVPKTPTINPEESDGSVVDGNSVSDYRQFQTKYDEGNIGSVEEEVLCGQWVEESSPCPRDERSSNEEDSVGGFRKRKLTGNSFDDASNSSVDKSSASDQEGRSTTMNTYYPKKCKLEDETESETDKGSTSDEGKSFKSNTFSDKKLQAFKIECKRESEKENTTDKEKSLKSNLFIKEKLNKEEDEQDETEKESTSDEGKTNKSNYFKNYKFKIEEDQRDSETERYSTSDEGKSNTSNISSPKKFKLEENKLVKERDSESSPVNPYNEDSNNSNLEHDVVVAKPQLHENEFKDHTSSSNSAKGSVRSHRHHYHTHKESSSHKSKYKDKTDEEDSTPSHSSKDKSYDKQKSSKERHKDKERKRSESSSSHSKSKHHDKDRVKDKKRSDKPDSNKDGKDVLENDSKHEHRERSRDHHDKEKKKHDKHAEKKQDTESSYKHEKDKKDSLNISHSSNSHKSSSEKHKHDKGQKHKDSSSKHRNHDKKSEKDEKQESKRKHREHCKTSDKDESRRSSDRDSNGPSGKGHILDHKSSSKLSSSRSNTETSVESSERTTSTSDDTVSDSLEVLHCDGSKLNTVSEVSITSPDHQVVKNSCVESDCVSSDQNDSREDMEDSYRSEKQSTDCSFDSKSSMCEKTDESLKESDDKNVAKRKISETDLVCFQDLHNKKVHNDLVNGKIDSIGKSSSKIQENAFGANPEITTQNMSLSVSSTHESHDNSSEKENIEQTLENIESSSGNLSSPDSEENKVKFKKPKIAANIFEVKKIMLERKKMKHLEKKRLKLLTKNTPEECSVNDCKDVGKEFKGFDEETSDKKEIYDSLIKRLSDEIDSAEANDINSLSLITSWIDMSPDLDEYVENVLKGKVHRKLRVRIPPISDEHYRFDPELKAFILLEDSLPTKDEKVDKNLNKLESDAEVEDNSLSPFDGSNVSKDLVPQSAKEISDESNDEFKCNEVSAETNSSFTLNKFNGSNSITPNPKPLFSLTFNQTYNEILKEKDESPKNPRTIIKITNDKSSEQMVVKTVNISSHHKYQVPTITRSAPKRNGQISKPCPSQNQMPLITRFKKSKDKGLSSSSIKCAPVNGSISPDFTINLEDETTISPELINSMIGIVDLTDKGTVKVNSSLTQDQTVEHRPTRESRHSGPRQQRYDSEDLYKPRLQLTTRRGRGQHISATVPDPPPATIETKRKRAAATSTTVSPKRRR